MAPIPDARVFFCGSGSEAVDTAMKLARLAHVLAGQPERTLIISRMRGYHGTNFGGTSAQGIAPNRDGWGPLVPDVVQVPERRRRGARRADGRAQRRDRRRASPSRCRAPAACSRRRRATSTDLRRLCDQHGALLIFDEVITGFGRLGTWFAADALRRQPDLMTFAKAVTSGYQPLGGVFVGAAVPGPRVRSGFVLRHGYTYSGHPQPRALPAWPTSRSSGAKGLLGRAKRIGARLGEGLRRWPPTASIDHARGDGAVWAAGLRPDQDAMAVRDRMLELGVITR